ncbi:MAG: aminotransferase class I/II-fold pyridoxal phosphate-dependent enzyme [Alphaproteobacteria bacterium]|nr:aminotransferase class I/II-fold pyridoxal phosphate-dependent enzyme [Alphaproteobacteria bacterium]
MQASEIRELLKVLEDPAIISFAGGIPDPTLFPTAEISAAYAAALSNPEKSSGALQYSVSEGYGPLRDWIVGYMGTRGIACTRDNVMIVTGSQQGLDLLGKLFIGGGDTVLVERPTYMGALQAFGPCEPNYDDLLPGSNATAASLSERAKSRGGRVAAAYCVPDFANPTGVSMTTAGREKLLDLCAELDVPLFEDAAYEALRYDGPAYPSCLELDIRRTGGIDASRVLYCGTFSKTISPGLRVGWVCGAKDPIRKLVLAKQAGDLHSATINQMVIHDVVGRCYDSQVAKVRDAYRIKRDAMLAALDRHMPKGTEWTKPDGGMFVWVTLAAGRDAGALLPVAIKREQVAYVPGRAFHATGGGENTLRLNFSMPTVERIEAGIARLGKLFA